MEANPKLISLGVSALVIIVIFALRARRMMRSTPYDPGRALLYPVIITVAGAYFAYKVQPQGMEWLWLVLALLLGAGLGWLRASTVRMSVDPATGKLMAQGSAVAIAFLFLLFVVRMALRYFLSSEASALGIRLIMADVLFVALAVGLLVARSAEMILRGRKLLAIHQAQPEVLDTDQAHI